MDDVDLIVDDIVDDISEGDSQFVINGNQKHYLNNESCEEMGPAE